MLDPPLNRLILGDARQREVAADELADLLRSGAPHQDEAERVMGELVEVAASGQPQAVTEAALHAINEAFGHYRPPLPLVRRLAEIATSGQPSVIEAVLGIVASTHDPTAADLIGPYLDHPDPAIRRAAEHAMVELPGRVALDRPAPGRYITPAYARQWARDVAADVALLTATFEQDRGYPCGDNEVAGPATERELETLTSGALRAVMPADLVAWYRQVREVSLPDVANGYFIHPPDAVVAQFGAGGVRYVSGRYDDEVIVFGSDGGGTLYAVRSASAAPVYRLPPSGVVDGVYSSDDPRFEVVADNLVHFLDLLRDVVHRFTDGYLSTDLGWSGQSR